MRLGCGAFELPFPSASRNGPLRSARPHSFTSRPIGYVRRWRRRAVGALWGALGLLLLLAAGPGLALAGGGPENVLLLVNANSEDSKTIANHYIRWRKIPPANVVYIDWKGTLATCHGYNFRDLILGPALQAIKDRGLSPQIDYLVYSADFPWGVNLASVFPEGATLPGFRPIGSLTGATYLAPMVMAGNPGLMMPEVNWYVPGPAAPNVSRCQQLGNVPSRAFSSRYRWNAQTQRESTPAKEPQYLLSTALGITNGRGNSVAEILAYLKRSIDADGTRPQGTVYFMRNKDIRSAVRHDCYDEAARQLLAAGVNARVATGILPNGAKDIAGLMVGAMTFDLKASQNAILPGAICEHLTSYGGIMTETASQTPLSEFLRMGAAGASGTVTEPHAMQSKFPLPSLQLHYARGCSLAEAFYQSVTGPYQLLVVGDPLCQPWAVFPDVKVHGVTPGQKVTGELTLLPAGAGGAGRSIGSYELFVDGRLVARSPPGRGLTMDTTKLSDGYHELRVVAIHADPIETRGRLIIPIITQNHSVPLEISAAAQRSVALDSTIQISLKQAGATALVVRHNHREVARIEGSEGRAEIRAAELGRGPVSLQAFSEGPHPYASVPLMLEIR